MAVQLSKLSSDGKVAYLIKPILKVLQEAGGKLERSEVKNRICALDEQIADFAEVVKVSKYTGKPYKEFTFKFDFAINNLSSLDYLTYSKENSSITLTEIGFDADVAKLDVDNEIMIPCKRIWNDRSARNNAKKALIGDTEKDEVDSNDTSSKEQLLSDFKEKLLKAIKNMTAHKFEAFSRALLNKMGVSFTDTSIQISKDGGIDGLGYHRDDGDFRTTRVVIQCKRFTDWKVGAPDIDKFLGAMNKFKADYGVFITSSRFTQEAKEAARAGTPIVTLIDGNELVELVIRYQLYITPVTTYVLDEFYTER